MSEVENVRVVVRIRPLSQREEDLGLVNVIQVDSTNQQISINRPGASSTPDSAKDYTFDYIMREDSTQTDVYCLTTKPIIDKVMLGYNGTVLAYGQTGTGKTYTMTGLRTQDQRGIIPNTFAHIFNHIALANKDLTFLVHVTYLEIYNEVVRDLLTPDAKAGKLEVREHSEHGVFVQNLSGFVVNTLEELERLLEVGDQNRSVGSTDLNFSSSRSHTIFSILIESSDCKVDDGKTITRGKLHLVDLAGSERQSKTRATGQRLKEATKINQSLSVLGNVISALVDGKSVHIPYRNSKLTRLLQDSLGGNSKTIMITTISPSENDYEETISTLRYANRAKNIKNHTHVNEQAKETLLLSFQTEIEELRKQLDITDISDDIEPDLLTDTDPSTPRKRGSKSSKKKKSASAPPFSQSVSAPPDGLANISEQDEELSKTKIEQEKIAQKLQQLTKKIIVGGVNLIEKAENQEFLLGITASQLDQAELTEQTLKVALMEREAERINIEERYSTLQEEVNGKTKKMKKLASMIAELKVELSDLQRENQREMEGLLDGVRGLTRELQLAELIINSYIPPEYQELIESYITWNEDIGEYHLKCVAYTGNNMRKTTTEAKAAPVEYKPPQCPYPYKQYSVKKKKTTNVPRPATRR